MADPSTGHLPDTYVRTDRRSAGRPAGTSPESLYLWQIAVLQTRIETLQDSVEQYERNLQHVIDHYEHVLDEQARDPEPLADGGASVGVDRLSSRPNDAPGILERLHSRLE